MKELLLIGPRYGKSKSIGGVVVLFELLLSDLDKLNIKYKVIDSNSKNYSSKLQMFFKVVSSIVNFTSYKKISLHGTALDYSYLGPIVLFANIIFGRSYSLRKFAGDFDEYFSGISPFGRFFIKILLRRSSANYFETKHLVREFSHLNPQTFWFPNVRSTNEHQVYPNEANVFNYVYISQLTAEKGFFDVVDAFSGLTNCNLTIFGPVKELEVSKKLECLPDNINYAGVIDPSVVAKTLSEFDAMVFPTFYKGEGYPGVIIEALSVSLPVITTNWRSIPEMFNQHSLFVPINDVSALKAKIKNLQEKHAFYISLSSGEFSKFDSFEYSKLFVKHNCSY